MNPITRQMTRAWIATTAAVTRTIDRIRNNDRGQGTLEYVGIVIAVVAVVAVVAVAIEKLDVGKKIGDAVTNMFKDINDAKPGSGGGGDKKKP